MTFSLIILALAGMVFWTIRRPATRGMLRVSLWLILIALLLVWLFAVYSALRHRTH